MEYVIFIAARIQSQFYIVCISYLPLFTANDYMNSAAKYSCIWLQHLYNRTPNTIFAEPNSISDTETIITFSTFLQSQHLKYFYIVCDTCLCNVSV